MPRAVAALVLCLAPLTAAYAGDPQQGSVTWTGTCSVCHGTPQPASAAAFSAYGNTFNLLSTYAQSANGNAIAFAVSPGYSPIPAGNLYVGGNTATSMSGYAATLGTNGVPTLTASNLAAYFASLFTPVVTNPIALTYGSGIAVSYQVTGTYFVTSATAGWGTTFSATGLPLGLGINASTGVISGTTPTVTAPTNYTVTVFAKNQGSGWGSATFTLTVNPPVPVVTSATVANVRVNTAFSYTITGTNTPTMWWGSGTLPTGLTPNTTFGASVPNGLISGTPTQIGSFPVTIWAGNVSGWGAGKTLTINVWGITSPATAAGTVGTAGFTYSIVTNGTLSGVNPYSSTALPAGLTLNTATGAISGTPATAGTYNVTVSALTTLGTVSQAVTITIAKGNQTIAFGAAPTVIFGSTGTVGAAATSGQAVTYSTVSTGCSVNATTGLVTGLAAGVSNCTITASQNGNANWNAATPVSQTFSILQASQTITAFASNPASLTVGGTATLSATGGGSGNPVVFSSQTTGICTVTGSTVTAIANGSCTVAANQAGNANYTAATQVTTVIAVGLNSQTLTFGPAPAVVYLGTGTVSATSSAALTPVTFTAAGGCTVTTATATSATVTGATVGTGNCAITASQAGNGTFAAATNTLTISIGKATQGITFGIAPLLTAGNVGTVSATASSGLAVTYSSTTPTICSVTGATVSGLAAGTCTIAADQAGDANWLAAPQSTQSFSIGQGAQTITFGAAPAVSVSGTGTVSAKATSGLTVTFTSSTPAVCTTSGADGSTVTGVTAGTCTIAASQAGDANWLAAPPATQSFTVGQGAQTVTFAAAPAVSVSGTGTVSATATSGLAVTFTSSTPAVCATSGTNGSTITGVSAGTCTITASQAGDASWLAAIQTQSFAIGQGAQTITFGAAPAVSVGITGTLSATASSGLAVTFSSQTTAVCTVSGTNGSTVTGVATGTCTIAANQAGDANYTAAAQVTQSFGIGVAPAPALTMNVQLNLPATLDLSYLPGITGADVAAQPAHGTVTVNGARLTYSPAANYFGTDTFAYVVYAGGSASQAAIVTVTITGRPDPTQDAAVTGLVNLETATAKRFRDAQVFNFQQRLESRHHALRSGHTPRSAAPSRSLSTLGDATTPASSLAGDAAASNAPSDASQLKYLFMLPGPNGMPSQADDSAKAPASSLLASTLLTSLNSSALSLNLGSVSSALSGNGGAAGDLEIWAAGNLRFGSRNQPGGGASIDFTTTGASIGADRRFSERLTLGMGVGYARDRSTIGLDGTGSKATGNSIAAYASYQASSAMFVDGLLGYGTLSMDTTRFVAPVNDFARANRGGSQTWGSLATGYEYRDEGFLLSPYARYDLAVDRLNAATEAGAGLYALNYGTQSNRSQQLSLGFRAEVQHQIDAGTAQPRMRIEYQRHLEGMSLTSVAYADQIGSRYNLTMPAANSNSLLIGLGSGFVLDNGINLDVDYQRQRTVSRDNLQAFNVRLSRQLDGRAGPPLDGFLSSLGLMADVGYTHETNVTHAASSSGDVRPDDSISLNLSKSKSFPVTDYTQLTLKGFANVDQFRTYTGLGHASLGAHAEFKYRYARDFGTPTFGVFARASTEQYQSRLRDGYKYSGGFTVRKPVTDRLSLFGSLADNERRGNSAVFDTSEKAVQLNLNYDLDDKSALYVTGEYRRGDLVFSGRPSLAIVDISTVLIEDDVFMNPQMFDYRVKGKTVLTTVGYNIPIGPKDSVDISWRHIRSTPTVTPPFPAPGIQYLDNQIMLDYLVAF